MNVEDDRFSSQGRDRIAREAAEWVARWEFGTIDEAEFERWRADPANAVAFARMSATLEATTEQPMLIPAEPAIGRRRLLQGSAAAFAAVAAGTGLFATRAYAWNSVSTEIGETSKLQLPDGSIVALNTDTLLYWRFSSDRRELWLERGEVALDLRPGPATRLRTDDDSAALAAGRFNARLRENALELIVLRGSATASCGQVATPTLPIQAYQKLSFADAKPSARPLSNDAVEAALAWQSGDVVFIDTPLSQAVAEYNRYLLRKIVIDDRSVAAIPVGGRFVSSDPSDFLEGVAASLHVRVRTTGSAYHITR